MRAEELVKQLERVRPSGRGYNAKCPAHDDKHNSLSVTQSEGRILVHCHAACTAQSVLAALGLTFKELFDRPDYFTGIARRDVSYDYCSETGELVYQILRGEKKRFKQRRPDGNGEWIWKLDGVPRAVGSA